MEAFSVRLFHLVELAWSRGIFPAMVLVVDSLDRLCCAIAGDNPFSTYCADRGVHPFVQHIAWDNVSFLIGCALLFALAMLPTL
jgi:hypothetical protein